MSPTVALRRVAHMDARELHFRARGALRIAAGRARQRWIPPHWDERRAGRLFGPHSPDGARAAALLRARRVEDAEEVLQHLFSTRPSCWTIAANRRREIAATIARRHPGAPDQARARAERILSGAYDLLGYRAVPYGPSPDWHADAVHGRRAAQGFWADVPYLDPALGDHKIIWELNRHQHWLTLGRAFWLTGDSRYARTFVEQLHSWRAANPPRFGINWASMLELALRAISWTWAIEFFAGSAAPARGEQP